MCSFVVPDAKQFGIKKIQVDEQIGITGIVEVDETLFLESRKGKTVETWIARC